MIVSILAIILALLRIIGIKTAFYQAAAHLFVGGLGGAWLIGRKPLHLYLLIGLTIVELLCAFLV